jgi:hypothetical protein
LRFELALAAATVVTQNIREMLIPLTPATIVAAFRHGTSDLSENVA